MENQAIRMKLLRERNLKKKTLNNQFLRAKRYRELKDREELFYKPIIVPKDDMNKFKEQEMKKIRSIKQNVMGEKPKIIRDKLKDMIFGKVSKLKRKRR